VPSEYLIEYGISKQLLYYVFLELNLRLPVHFDQHPTSTSSENPISRRASSPLSTPLLPSRASSISSIASSVNVPSRASSPQESESNRPENQGTPSSDLDDMERRRREELMARKKIVQESRRLKNQRTVAAVKLEEPPPVTTSIVASETVESFLNSIAPSESPTEIQPPHIPDNNDSMDVDTTMNALPPSRHSSADTPPASAVSVASSSSVASFVIPANLPPRPPRRGTKRPVASDFVDMDAPSLPGIMTPTSAPSRPSSATFAKVIQGRCVIDLSDSEDDGPAIVENVNWLNRDKRSKTTKHSATPIISTPSAATLAQKEKEIQRMRELIAQKEEQRRTAVGLDAARRILLLISLDTSWRTRPARRVLITPQILQRNPRRRKVRKQQIARVSIPCPIFTSNDTPGQTL